MIKREGITYRFLKWFVLLIVIPMISMNLLAYYLYSRLLENNSAERMQETMQQIVINLENEIKTIILTEALISNYNNNEIVDMVTAWSREGSNEKKLQLSQQIDSKLGIISNYRNSLDAIIFFLRDGYYYFYKRPPQESVENIRQQEWYRSAVSHAGKAVLSATLNNVASGRDDAITISISPMIVPYRSDVEVVYISWKIDVFDRIMMNVNKHPEDHLLVADKEGRILYSSQADYAGRSLNDFVDHDSYFKPAPESQKFRTFVIDGKKKLYSAAPIRNTDWSLLYLVDDQQMKQGINVVFQYSVGIFMLILSLFFFFTILFFKKIVTPVRQLIKQMKIVETGNIDIAIEPSGNGEIGQLGRSFNRMIQEIKILMAERDMKETLRSRAEIEALQLQINPHFIANTLNTIRLMAMVARADNMRLMIEAFIKLLNNAFGKNGYVATVAQEIEHLDSYVYIMQVRYGKTFDIHFDMDSAITDRLMLKMVLQPILENAIFHGVQEIERQGVIRIKGFSDQTSLYFEVMDNGRGMSEHEIDALLQGDHPNQYGFNRIGLKNVERRIKLHYGASYGISIQSALNEYTTVTVRLPLLVEEFIKEDAHAQNVDRR